MISHDFPITCRLVSVTDEAPRKVGDMYFAPALRTFGGLSEIYKATIREDPSFRDPIYLVLPFGHFWLLDGKPSDGGKGWTITGTAPKITASPSIWCNAGKPNEFHGWLKDGLITSV